ncbi:helix-turn-helix domain-containing protein [Fusobacterium mortiferum]|uniref:helix-turn-helix domain-containing protein n=1 Tax=Fusobacterium mortiferum TaxID=850 RepID=UPI001958E853|nr:helix-turn-helix domain-containing protein [Fusobacterium mortiferum]
MKSQRMKTEKAAQLLGLPVQTLRVFIQNGKFPEFATAIKKEGSKHWIYYINATRLYEYLKMKESIQTAI